MSRQIYGLSATIPTQLLVLFSLDHKEIKLLIAHRAKKEVSHLPFHFSICLNVMEDVIIGGGVVARPLQFPFRKLVENPSCISVVHLLQVIDVDH